MAAAKTRQAQAALLKKEAQDKAKARAKAIICGSPDGHH